MIIEIKEMPEGQKIEKIDIHIDFIKDSYTVDIPIANIEHNAQNIEHTAHIERTEQNKQVPSIPDEMLNGDF